MSLETHEGLVVGVGFTPQRAAELVSLHIRGANECALDQPHLVRLAVTDELSLDGRRIGTAELVLHLMDHTCSVWIAQTGTNRFTARLTTQGMWPCASI